MGSAMFSLQGIFSNPDMQVKRKVVIGASAVLASCPSEAGQRPASKASKLRNS